MGKMKELFKKIVGNIKGTLYTSMGMIKDWNHKNLKEEEIKKWWQEYTEELYQKGFYNWDNQDGMVTHLETDIWDCEAKWALWSITVNSANSGNRIPVELFQILKCDAIKVPYSICQQIWKVQQWLRTGKGVFIPIPKNGSAKGCSNYQTDVLISHASKVMLKILQARFQQCVSWELQDVQGES